MKVKTHIDPNTGDVFLDLENFKSFVNVKKVKYYSLEEVDDDGVKALILKFYDKKRKVIQGK